MIEDLNTRLEDRLILTAMDNLGAKQQMELEKITKATKDPGLRAQSIENFLKTNIPDYEKVFSAALLDFRNLYIGA